MDLSDVPEPIGEYVIREIGGETLLVPVKASAGELDSLFTVNEVGAVVWRAVEARSSVRDIVAAVVSGFEIDRESAQRDVIEFLELLARRGLVRTAGE